MQAHRRLGLEVDDLTAAGLAVLIACPLPHILVAPGEPPADATDADWSAAAAPALKQRRPSLPSRPSPLSAHGGTICERPLPLNPLTLPPTTSALSLLNRRATCDSATLDRTLRRTLGPGESLGCTHSTPSTYEAAAPAPAAAAVLPGAAA